VSLLRDSVRKRIAMVQLPGDIFHETSSLIGFLFASKFKGLVRRKIFLYFPFDQFVITFGYEIFNIKAITFRVTV
jgi:hypothetical protein